MYTYLDIKYNAYLLGWNLFTDLSAVELRVHVDGVFENPRVNLNAVAGIYVSGGHQTCGQSQVLQQTVLG